MNILPHYRNLLQRDSLAIIHFNDVFAERAVDIDAELTTRIRNLGSLSDLTFPIGKQPTIADYSINLLNDLIEERARIIQLIQERNGKDLSQQFHNKTILSIINKADRNETTTAHGKNGEDFHLAITNNGLEIYAVPLKTLKTLETRNKILALYRIPNEKFVVSNGQKEQFRSSMIATTRYFPEILEPIFQYNNEAELLEAKQKKTHPTVIPVQDTLAQFAFADKFGNVRIFVKDNTLFTQNIQQRKYGETISLHIGNKSLELLYVTSLKEIPINTLAIYQNIADKAENTGYWEIVKKSADCNNDAENAFALLKKFHPSFEQEELTID